MLIYHRLESPTQTPETARLQEESGEVWGHPPRFSDIPAVQAYTGSLPDGERGIKFVTDVASDPNSPPGQACWRGPRPGVVVEDNWAKIKARVTRNTQT